MSATESNSDGKRTSMEQLEYFVAFMTDYPQLMANKNDPTDPERVKKLWGQLGEALNAINGPTRSAAKWKETLSHWKNQLRSRARKAKVDRLITGGGPSSKIKFKDFEERALQAFGSVAVDGLPEIPTLGLEMTTNAAETPLLSSQENEEDFEYQNTEFLENSFLSITTEDLHSRASSSNSQQHSSQPLIIPSIVMDEPALPSLPYLPTKSHKGNNSSHDLMRQLLEMSKAREERDKLAREENVRVQQSIAESLKSLADSIKLLSEAIQTLCPRK